MTKGRLIGGAVAAMLAALGVLTIEEEGFKTDAYPDPVHGWNVPTACAGDTGPHIQRGMVFTREACLNMMSARHQKLWRTVEKCLRQDVYPHQAIAILSLADNAGAGAVCGSTMLSQLNAGLPPEVWCKQFSRWVYAKGKDCRIASNNCRGIVLRRERAQMMCEGRL